MNNMLIVKLEALSKKIDHWLEHNRADYYRPSAIIDMFQQFERIKTELKNQYPKLADDVPSRGIPKSSGTSDFDGEGYLTCGSIEVLGRDVRYCYDLLVGATRVSEPKDGNIRVKDKAKLNDYVRSATVWANSHKITAYSIVAVIILLPVTTIIYNIKGIYSEETPAQNVLINSPVNSPMVQSPVQQSSTGQQNINQQTIVHVNPLLRNQQQVLTPMATKLLETLYRYQVETGLNKLVIGRNGEVHFDEQNLQTKYRLNVITDLFSTQTDTSSRIREFEYIMDSIPATYLARIPETRLDNPYVVQVTEEGVRYCLMVRNQR